MIRALIHKAIASHRHPGQFCLDGETFTQAVQLLAARVLCGTSKQTEAFPGIQAALSEALWQMDFGRKDCRSRLAVPPRRKTPPCHSQASLWPRRESAQICGSLPSSTFGRQGRLHKAGLPRPPPTRMDLAKTDQVCSALLIETICCEGCNAPKKNAA